MISGRFLRIQFRRAGFLGAVLKYEVGVVPSDFLNIEIKALGVLYPASKAACVTLAPSANRRSACISLSCCLHFPNVIPASS